MVLTPARTPANPLPIRRNPAVQHATPDAPVYSPRHLGQPIPALLQPLSGPLYLSLPPGDPRGADWIREHTGPWSRPVYDNAQWRVGRRHYIPLAHALAEADGIVAVLKQNESRSAPFRGRNPAAAEQTPSVWEQNAFAVHSLGVVQYRDAWWTRMVFGPLPTRTG